MQGGQGGVRGERRGELNTARARRLIQVDVLPLKESSQQLGNGETSSFKVSWVTG